jgi:hypothetical protein
LLLALQEFAVLRAWQLPLQAFFRGTEGRRESPARAMATIFSDAKTPVNRGDSPTAASCALGDIE